MSASRLQAAWSRPRGQPADPHARLPRAASCVLAALLRQPRLPRGGVGVRAAPDAGDAAAGGPGGEPPGALEADLLDHAGEEAGGEQVAGAGDVDDLGRQRRHVQVDAAADEPRPAAAHLADHEADAGVEQEVEGLREREAAEHLELLLGGEQVGAAVQDRQEALDALARVDLAGVEGDLGLGGQPLEQRQLRRERPVADEAREVGEARLRGAPRQVARREGVVGRRPHEVAAFAVLVEQHVHAAGLAVARHEPRLRRGQLARAGRGRRRRRPRARPWRPGSPGAPARGPCWPPARRRSASARRARALRRRRGARWRP